MVTPTPHRSSDSQRRDFRACTAKPDAGLLALGFGVGPTIAVKNRHFFGGKAVEAVDERVKLHFKHESVSSRIADCLRPRSKRKMEDTPLIQILWQ